MPPDKVEDRDPGRARERTGLAWTRTAMSVAAVGGAILKRDVAIGVAVLAMSPPSCVPARTHQRTSMPSVRPPMPGLNENSRPSSRLALQFHDAAGRRW